MALTLTIHPRSTDECAEVGCTRTYFVRWLLSTGFTAFTFVQAETPTQAMIMGAGDEKDIKGAILVLIN